MQTDYLHRTYVSEAPVHIREVIWFGRSLNASGDIFPLTYAHCSIQKFHLQEDNVCTA